VMGDAKPGRASAAGRVAKLVSEVRRSWPYQWQVNRATTVAASINASATGADVSACPGSASAVVMLLEAGCTDAEVAAITGQSREMIVHYSVMVNQSKLGRAAISNGRARTAHERKLQNMGSKRLCFYR
jgi:hypothetical protein